MDDRHSDDGNFTRRSVLRRGATVAGAAAVGVGALSGTAAADEHDSAEKRGGRAQIEGEPRRNEPFELVLQGMDERNASCMSPNSATQVYLEYDLHYCDSQDDESDASLFVIPDESELAPDEVFEIRSIIPCRASENQRVAFGPSNQEC